jgi:SPP1 gp7 family putative phage head morphogenesis protein
LRRDILAFARDYKQALLSHEKGVARDLVSHYGQAYLNIQKALQDLSQKMQAARDRGEKIKLAWLQESERLASFLRQVESQIGRFAESADVLISNGQKSLVDAGVQYAKDAAKLGLSRSEQAMVGNTWNRVPKEALEALVGTLHDGSPLKTLLDDLAPDAKGKADKVLTNAVIQGTGPRQTARELKKELGKNLDNALTISRTEQLRSSRTATIESYRANSDIIDGWTRIETLDDSTCIICIAEHGRIYTLEEDFETHPNCRGTLVPNVIGRSQPIETGEEQFAKWSDERQLETLGAEKYEAYKSGKVKLYDFVQRTYSEDWGGGRRERTLDQALEHAAA